MALKDILNVTDIYEGEFNTEKLAEMSAEEVLNLWGDIRELNGQAVMADRVDRYLRETMKCIFEAEKKYIDEPSIPEQNKIAGREFFYNLKHLLWGDNLFWG